MEPVFTKRLFPKGEELVHVLDREENDEIIFSLYVCDEPCMWAVDEIVDDVLFDLRCIILIVDIDA